MSNPYQMAIDNVARKIRGQGVGEDTPELNAFEASKYLGAAFCKAPEEVLADILNSRR